MENLSKMPFRLICALGAIFLAGCVDPLGPEDPFVAPVTDVTTITETVETLEPNAIITDSNLEIRVFNIAGERVSCEGVAPMQCLVVNGEYFYDDIIGYAHVKGRPARICVQEIPRPGEVPADAGTVIYQRVVCGGLLQAYAQTAERTTVLT